jgi:hypothetical protein
LLRRILVIAMAVGLAACTAIGLKPPTGIHAAAAAPPPSPAEGLWAILDPGCERPHAANIHAWPTCASPFWIQGGKAVVLTASLTHTRRRPHDTPYAADYSVTPGEPLIVQVGTAKDGYVYLALTSLSTDGQGRLVGAVGAAVACPRPGASGGALAISPSANGCDLQSLEALRKAAMVALHDRAALAEAAWIGPGAPTPQ